jgi:hypothetical protein
LIPHADVVLGGGIALIRGSADIAQLDCGWRALDRSGRNRALGKNRRGQAER